MERLLGTSSVIFTLQPPAILSLNFLFPLGAHRAILGLMKTCFLGFGLLLGIAAMAATPPDRNAADKKTVTVAMDDDDGSEYMCCGLPLCSPGDPLPPCPFRPGPKRPGPGPLPGCDENHPWLCKLPVNPQAGQRAVKFVVAAAGLRMTHNPAAAKYPMTLAARATFPDEKKNPLKALTRTHDLLYVCWSEWDDHGNDRPPVEVTCCALYDQATGQYCGSPYCY